MNLYLISSCIHIVLPPSPEYQAGRLFHRPHQPACSMGNWNFILVGRWEYSPQDGACPTHTCRWYRAAVLPLCPQLGSAVWGKQEVRAKDYTRLQTFKRKPECLPAWAYDFTAVYPQITHRAVPSLHLPAYVERRFSVSSNSSIQKCCF